VFAAFRARDLVVLAASVAAVRVAMCWKPPG
jgi:hypothetical protein